MSLTKLYNFSSVENAEHMAFDADVDILFWVQTGPTTKELAIDLTLSKMWFDFSAIVQGLAVKPKINVATLDAVIVKSSTFGDVDMAFISDILQEGIE